MEVGGDAGDSLIRVRIANATITMKACHLTQKIDTNIIINMSHLINVVTICRYLVFVTLQKTNNPIVLTKPARKIL